LLPNCVVDGRPGGPFVTEWSASESDVLVAFADGR
jgi:hypothetical protein